MNQMWVCIVGVIYWQLPIVVNIPLENCGFGTVFCCHKIIKCNSKEKNGHLLIDPL